MPRGLGIFRWRLTSKRIRELILPGAEYQPPGGEYGIGAGPGTTSRRLSRAGDNVGEMTKGTQSRIRVHKVVFDENWNFMNGESLGESDPSALLTNLTHSYC